MFMPDEEKCFLLVMIAGEIEITWVEFRIVLNNNSNFGVLLKLSVLLRYGKSSFFMRFLLRLEIQWENPLDSMSTFWAPAPLIIWKHWGINRKKRVKMEFWSNFFEALKGFDSRQYLRIGWKVFSHMCITLMDPIAKIK